MLRDSHRTHFEGEEVDSVIRTDVGSWCITLYDGERFIIDADQYGTVSLQWDDEEDYD